MTRAIKSLDWWWHYRKLVIFGARTSSHFYLWSAEWCYLPAVVARRRRLEVFITADVPRWSRCARPLSLALGSALATALTSAIATALATALAAAVSPAFRLGPALCLTVLGPARGFATCCGICKRKTVILHSFKAVQLPYRWIASTPRKSRCNCNSITMSIVPCLKNTTRYKTIQNDPWDLNEKRQFEVSEISFVVPTLCTQYFQTASPQKIAEKVSVRIPGSKIINEKVKKQ